MIQDLRLKLGGEKRHFTFGLTFLGEVMEKYDPLTLEEVLLKAVKFPAKYVPSLMYESLRNTYIMNGEDVVFTEVDIKKWLEKEPSYGSEYVTKFLTTFLQTNENKTPVKSDDNDVDLKKK